ncbi:MAG: hypothetical protein F2836_00435, partial [Actinobacteria bacterium]|nr:hypothetical protein [Actinomycetota bacterium]
TGTNPEQLLGAALARCFSMSLTNLIEESGIAGEGVVVRTDAVVRSRSSTRRRPSRWTPPSPRRAGDDSVASRPARPRYRRGYCRSGG